VRVGVSPGVLQGVVYNSPPRTCCTVNLNTRAIPLKSGEGRREEFSFLEKVEINFHYGDSHFLKMKTPRSLPIFLME